MKHSIKRQMTVVFSGLIIFILVMMFLVYSKCLETYYIMHKESDLLEVHKTVGTALAQGNKEDERAWKVMERTNISMLVLQDNQVIFSPRGDQEQLVSQLRGYVFNQNQDEGELLKSTDNYEIRKIRDPVAGIDYLEMWGTYSNGAIFILRSPLDSIWESTALANKLLVYVGIAALVLGGILVSLFARKITEPITELASLSRRMSELDFDARYTGGGEDEIGTLGNNFNIMSERLEKTVPEQYSYTNTTKPYVSIELKKPNLENYQGLELGKNKKQIEAEFEYCDFIILTDCVTWMFLKKDEPVKDEKVVCLIQEGKWLQMEQRDSNNERMGNIHMKEPEQWDDLVNTIRTFVAEAKKQRKE